jgi:Crinkler effector protein N-terminal domain
VAKLVLHCGRATMSDHQPTKWELFCVVVNENSPFPVEIQSDATVGALKKAIKLEKQPEFDDFAADRLTLFKIAVPAANKDERLAAFATNLPSTQMDPLYGLNEYFSDTPPGHMIHILVQTPGTRK